MSEQNRLPMAMGEYIYGALTKARYQMLEDGTIYADIFLCPGVWAIGDTPEECRDALADALSDWLHAAYEGRDLVTGMDDLAWLNPRWQRMRD